MIVCFCIFTIIKLFCSKNTRFLIFYFSGNSFSVPLCCKNGIYSFFTWDVNKIPLIMTSMSIFDDTKLSNILKLPKFLDYFFDIFIL